MSATRMWREKERLCGEMPRSLFTVQPGRLRAVLFAETTVWYALNMKHPYIIHPGMFS
jgi:hypothetical protein